ncbi:hypothetical protein E4T56_gene11836 [Termitomyces sp. T112]|nr:hypothetical protein E4T56_gene11836 [Termitomyces sp. T112]
MTINKSQTFNQEFLHMANFMLHSLGAHQEIVTKNFKWFTNHLMYITGPCSIDILNSLQIISNIYQWTL